MAKPCWVISTRMVTKIISLLFIQHPLFSGHDGHFYIYYLWITPSACKVNFQKMTNLEAMEGRRRRQQLNPFLINQSSCFLQFSYLQITQWSTSQVSQNPQDVLIWTHLNSELRVNQSALKLHITGPPWCRELWLVNLSVGEIWLLLKSKCVSFLKSNKTNEKIWKARAGKGTLFLSRQRDNQAETDTKALLIFPSAEKGANKSTLSGIQF